MKVLKVSLMALALIVTACERDSDPVKDYADLKSDVPQKDYRSNEQKFSGQLFEVQVTGRQNPQDKTCQPVDSEIMSFFEGQEATYCVQTRVFPEGGAIKIKKVSFPEGAELSESTTPGLWLIKWTPPKDIIPPAARSLSLSPQVEVVVDQNSSARAREILSNPRVNRIKKLNLSVNFSDAQPSVKVVGLEKVEDPGIKQGDWTKFTIEVVDPNSSEKRKPRVSITFDYANFSNEAKVFQAQTAVLVDNQQEDKYAGNGKWIFHRIFDSSLIKNQFLQTMAGYAGGELIVVVTNRQTGVAAEVLKRVKIIVPADSKKGGPEPKRSAS